MLTVYFVDQDKPVPPLASHVNWAGPLPRDEDVLTVWDGTEHRGYGVVLPKTTASAQVNLRRSDSLDPPT